MTPVASLPGEWIDRVGPVDGVDVVPWDLDGTPERADEIDLVCMPDHLSGHEWGFLPQAPSVRVVQLLSAGFEHALPHIGPGVTLANARGVHSAATSELALTLTLALQRGVWQWVDNHRRHTWQRQGFCPGLADQHVMIVGYGSIGRAVARRVAAFEPAGITAVASRPHPGDELVDAVHGIDEIGGMLVDQDVVIIVVPGGEATRHLVDAPFLAAMKEGALLVNVGRGSVVDTDALVAACRSGHVRAGLDVTDPEPLPDDHPLWTTPGVLMSPHVGGAAEGFWSRASALLRRQLQHLAAGEQLENIVA
ncbi:NAD(P)-dependent oxidoreductase [Acidipropionibacterium timonense]|uniref:NAD(P)-dependent oxidoreductase n=1 Tax=Acidipropionibacterium timonense TaxID=2161818 RepID=UPI001031F5CF|nr:NAD(P)-dependent oxidoreductase [Acidipropionibacterium timonense]